MARALFARGAKGSLIAELQTGLIREGIPLARIDGDFGQRTHDGVRAFQGRSGVAPTGIVDTDAWVTITGKPVPTLFERCLQITAAFEGHDYTVAAGNWDNAWLTWGVIGFTLKSGRVAEIVQAVAEAAPQCIRTAFGANADTLLDVIDGTPAQKLAWADSISAPPKGHRLIEPWQSAFARFGEFPEVQAVQRACASEMYFLPAVQTAGALGLTTELGIALCFDIHVQNGGVARSVRQGLPPIVAGQPELPRREAIANGVADNAIERFRENVRKRKLAIATGAGEANGVPVVLANWGLDDVTAVV
jgi:hypothetical protein